MTTRINLSGVSAQKNLGHVFLEVKYSRNLLEKKRRPLRPRRRIGGKDSKDFLKIPGAL